MAKFDVEGAQNVEVSKKIPCEKPLLEQLKIMERYTAVHRQFTGGSNARREVECLKVIFPTLFRSIEDQDLIAGRLDFLPIGFGTVTSVGGVGHYCVFNKLRAFQKEITALGQEYADRVETLYQYWLDHDLKTLYCREVLTDTTIGRFIDTEYPLIATARLSGMMLDYPTLLSLGIGGLRERIAGRLREDPGNEFLQAGLLCLDIFVRSAEALKQDALSQRAAATPERAAELARMAEVLEKIKEDAPSTFPEALQLLWLYALLAGVINYGRLDDFLGPFLANDLASGALTEQEAYRYVKSLWTLIENRRTTVNGRIIVGGRGRKHPKEADIFLHIAMKVARDCRYVEPQFTLLLD